MARYYDSYMSAAMDVVLGVSVLVFGACNLPTGNEHPLGWYIAGDFNGVLAGMWFGFAISRATVVYRRRNQRGLGEG